MKSISHRFRPLFQLVAFLATGSLAQAHSHFGAGVNDLNGNNLPDIGEPLKLVVAPTPGFQFHLIKETNSGSFGALVNYYSISEVGRTQFPNDTFTFTALAATNDFITMEPGHAAVGSYIWMEISSVSGPAGASFGFWDENSYFFDTEPTQSFLTNQSTGGYKFILSEGFDAAGEDPLGHIHGRAWTVNQPGTYTVGFTLYDLGHQGPGGGPIHTPSQTYYFTFVAVPEASVAGLLLSSLLWPALRRPRRR